MRTETRRAAAYIAARLDGTSRSSIYDYSEGSWTHFSGRADARSVNVYDHTLGAHVGGAASSSGSYSLYHYGFGSHLDLRRTGEGRYTGYDYGTSHHYSVTVTDSTVSLYDYGTSSFFSFSL